jgi:hypothetical protein
MPIRRIGFGLKDEPPRNSLGIAAIQHSGPPAPAKAWLEALQLSVKAAFLAGNDVPARAHL